MDFNFIFKCYSVFKKSVRPCLCVLKLQYCPDHPRLHYRFIMGCFVFYMNHNLNRWLGMDGVRWMGRASYLPISLTSTLPILKGTVVILRLFYGICGVFFKPCFFLFCYFEPLVPKVCKTPHHMPLEQSINPLQRHPLCHYSMSFTEIWQDQNILPNTWNATKNMATGAFACQLLSMPFPNFQ